MTQATNAEVKAALQSLLAHLEPLDDNPAHYSGRVWTQLKAKLSYRKNIEKRAWFKIAPKARDHDLQGCRPAPAKIKNTCKIYDYEDLIVEIFIIYRIFSIL